MNYSTEYMGCKFDIEYSVDSEGDYEEFIIEVAGQCVNDVLDKGVIANLEQFTWELDFIPGCKEHNDDMKVDRYLSSIDTAGA